MYHSRFRGTHYDAGYRYGNLIYKKGIRLENAFNLTDEKFAFGKLCIKEYEKVFPEILDEIRGMAKGQRVSFEELASFIFSMYCFVFNNLCTCFAFKDEDNIIFGRNSDFITSLADKYESTYYCLDKGYSFIGNTTAMIQMEDGINEYGLAVGLTFIYPTVIKPGLNSGMLVRYLLEKCKSVDEAVKQLYKLPIGSAQTITMVDSTGDMVVVECNSENVEIVRPKESRSFVSATNHFLSEKMIKYQFDGDDDIHSHERYETVYNALRNNTYSLKFAEDLLSGKLGFICQYNRNEGFDTVWSSIYDIKNKNIYRVEGNPSRKKFKEDTRLKFIY